MSDLRRRSAVVAVLFSVIVAGCGTAQDSDPGSVGVAASAPEATDASEGGLVRFIGPFPLDSLLLEFDAAEAMLDEVDRSVDIAVADCLKQNGFEDVPLPDRIAQHDSPDPAGGLPDSIMRELIDVKYQTSHGYGLVEIFSADLSIDTQVIPDEPTTNEHDPYAERDAYTDSLSDDVVFAFLDANFKCLGDALTNAYPKGFEEGSLLTESLEEVVMADGDVRLALDSWRDCMAAAGYPVTSFEDVPGLLLRHAADVAGLATVQALFSDFVRLDADQIAAVTGYELAIASQDLECYRSIAGDLHSARTAAEREYLDANQDRLNAFILAANEMLEQFQKEN